MRFRFPKIPRIILVIIPIILYLGLLLCLLLTFLTGSTNKSIFKRFYWLQADTSSYPGTTNQITRWTTFNRCAVSSGGHNIDCGSTVPAYPFSPKDNFDSSVGLPSGFIENRDTYYYLSRVAFSFILIGLAFLGFGIIPVFLFLILGRMKVIALVFYFLGFIFSLTSIVLYTACFVKGRNTFQDNNSPAKLGSRTFGVAWTSVACLIFIIPFLFTTKSESFRKYGFEDDSNEKSWLLNRRKRREQRDYERDQFMNQRDAYVNEHGGVNFMPMIQQREMRDNGQRQRQRAFTDDSDQGPAYTYEQAQPVANHSQNDTQLGDTTVATNNTGGSKFNFFKVKKKQSKDMDDNGPYDGDQTMLSSQNQKGSSNQAGMSYEEQVQATMKKIEKEREQQQQDQ